MTDRTHPDSGRIITSSDVIADLQDRIAELESELEAIGAGGVQALSAAPAGFVPVAAFDRLHAHAESLAARLLAAEQAAPKAAPATQQAGDVVAYLDVGASGYLDLGAALSEDALQQLPKGRHALVIAGTYGIDGYVAAPQPSPTTKPAPKQEAQEPVGVVEHAQAQTSYIHWTAAPPPNGAKPYTAPQPATSAEIAMWKALSAVQQPVVREPLTDEQIAEMMRETWGCASIAPRHALEFARAVERAHSIKGGQHD